MQKAITILSLLALSDCRISFGKCDSPQLQDSFDATSYMGLWYEIYKDPTFYWEKGGSCTTANYALKDDGTI